MRIEKHVAAAGREDLQTEHIRREIRRGTGRPSVAEAVAELDIAVRAEVAVDVDAARRDDSVDARGAFRPVDAEIFPECRRAEFEHLAPVTAHDVEGRFVFARRADRREGVIPEEGGEAARTVLRDAGAEGFLRIDQSAEGKKRRGLFPAVIGRDVREELVRREEALLRRVALAEGLHHLAAC